MSLFPTEWHEIFAGSNFREFSIDSRQLHPVKINSRQKKSAKIYSFYLHYRISIKLVANNITTTTCILYNCNGESLLSLGKLAFEDKETTVRYSPTGEQN